MQLGRAASKNVIREFQQILQRIASASLLRYDFRRRTLGWLIGMSRLPSSTVICATHSFNASRHIPLS